MSSDTVFASFPTLLALRCSSVLRYYEGSDSCPLHLEAGLPAYLTQTSQHSVSNHVYDPDVALHAIVSSASDGFQASPHLSKLAVICRRIEFALLRTASSRPVALHPTSLRRSYLRLRSLGLLRHGLAPCSLRAFAGALGCACAPISSTLAINLRLLPSPPPSGEGAVWLGALTPKWCASAP